MTKKKYENEIIAEIGEKLYKDFRCLNGKINYKIKRTKLKLTPNENKFKNYNLDQSELYSINERLKQINNKK